MGGYNETLRAVAASMKQLSVEYLDLVMIHHRAADISDWPRKACPMKDFPEAPTGEWGPPACSIQDPTWLTCQDETWRALLQLKKHGVVRTVGVGNWRTENLKRMLRLGQELPAVNQVEAHVGWHDDELNSWCKQHGVVVQAA